MKILRSFFKDESGATMVEYALMVGLIAIAVAAILIVVQGALNGLFQDIATCVGGGECNRDGA